MLRRFQTIFNTVRHLKVTQLFHQVRYRLVSHNPLTYYMDDGASEETYPLKFAIAPPSVTVWKAHGVFTFLNKTVVLGDKIDWNYQGQGKLWNYNLQYANYLHQPEVSNDKKANLMRDQYTWLSDGRLRLEPYPASLRSINMIRWMSEHDVRDPELRGYLYADLSFVSTRLEYHLLGNHLLENAFALMMGGAFFAKTAWLEKGRKILEEELGEQILPDGAHFELSPMYHQIILFRILELLDWYSSWALRDLDFEMLLRQKASDMISWLGNISFKNHDVPHFNDSSDGIAYPTAWLFQYANLLGIVGSGKPMRESGYRSVAVGEYELKIDFAQVGASYQPGHAHADALSFILYYKSTPLFVEQGTSTYQASVRRQLERSTQAHNTVVIEGRSQSEMWGVFRVARRARTTILRDGLMGVYEAKHDGYKPIGVVHERKFEISHSALIIVDTLSRERPAVSYLHLHPDVTIIDLSYDAVTLSNGVRVVYEGVEDLRREEYDLAVGFNTLCTSTRLVASFSSWLKTCIHLWPV